MERHQAWAFYVEARAELAKYLGTLDREDCTWTMQVIALDQAVEYLHRMCAEFEDGDAAEIHEDCYLPIFDALSHVTSARYLCNSRGPRVSLIQRIKDQCELARDAMDEPINVA